MTQNMNVEEDDKSDDEIKFSFYEMKYLKYKKITQKKNSIVICQSHNIAVDIYTLLSLCNSSHFEMFTDKQTLSDDLRVADVIIGTPERLNDLQCDLDKFENIVIIGENKTFEVKQSNIFQKIIKIPQF